ncbi:nuclear transport factor 2 family protein [Psychroserpens sp. XS_ASV72]|uniref:nuclear transport factor 2 family protein n=1 Tax=Psychroserpens sp. XS_ASV72 TaxID=3241293 RepID=UPI0035114F37
MKSPFLYLFLCISIICFGQTNTEIFLFDILQKDSQIEISQGKNISNNEGYDNQPSFLNDRYILFSSTRNGQTDIAKYDTRYDSKTWINFTPGGEYTPLAIPNNRDISAVRLDSDGKQRLYAYNRSNGESRELIPDLVVAYYTWFDEHTIVSAVIEDNQLNLFTSNIHDGINRKYVTNVGRSFHKIPNSNLVSFISKSDENQWQIKSLDPKTGVTKVIANTLEGVEDICWLDDKTLLSGKESTLYKLRLKRDNNWKPVSDLSTYGITNITRLAVDNTQGQLLIAGEVSTKNTTSEETTENSNENTNTSENSTSNEATVEAIVQRNLEAYNNRDIDAFMADYAEDVKLYAYPNTLQTEGKEAMRKSYKDWFEGVPDLRAFVKKRIVFKNKIIDEEQVTANGQIINAVAIYEVENGKIVKVTFIQ